MLTRRRIGLCLWSDAAECQSQMLLPRRRVFREDFVTGLRWLGYPQPLKGRGGGQGLSVRLWRGIPRQGGTGGKAKRPPRVSRAQVHCSARRSASASPWLESNSLCFSLPHSAASPLLVPARLYFSFHTPPLSLLSLYLSVRACMHACKHGSCSSGASRAPPISCAFICWRGRSH